ncbi:hypothetical protein C8A05DRAFT_43980 [Staphylotrichum tortipilum]|uniref:NYN domain-containing protein n=1 Tax=Staphylotrichum tortipilum TaxID=2831512 RepID=A0AAN6RU66_9PEZI|nr:hypothetical protein C8A05DRAFT_43980 [Staphylotrichum longicolle]
MSAPQHSHLPGQGVGNIFICIDNSNLWIQGQRTYAEKKGLNVPCDPTWRFDVGRLREILLNNSGLTADEKKFVVKVQLYGSAPPPVETVWTAMAAHDVNVNTFERSSWTGREKQVDTELIADAIEQAYEAFQLKIPTVFIIVSGDRDVRSAVTRITKKRDCQVHLWSWSNGLARVFTQDDKDIAQHLFRVHLLDDYLYEIGFHASEFRADRAMINQQSIVVLDPRPKADKVEEFLQQLRMPVYRYEISPKREGASSRDLAIIPAFDPSITDDDLRRLFIESKGKLESKGLRVLTHLEYTQKYPVRGGAGNALTISNRFRELSMDAEDPGAADDGGDDHHDHDGDPAEKKPNNDPAEEEPTNDDGYTDVNQRLEKQRARMRRNEETAKVRCFWRRYCSHGLRCTFGHTKDEASHFQTYGRRKPKKHQYCTDDKCLRGKNCFFAHGPEEIFCPTCDKTGEHEMVNCPERYPSASKNYN